MWEKEGVSKARSLNSVITVQTVLPPLFFLSYQIDSSSWEELGSLWPICFQSSGFLFVPKPPVSHPRNPLLLKDADFLPSLCVHSARGKSDQGSALVKLVFKS